MATGTLTRVGQHDWLALSLLADQAYEVTVTGLDGLGSVEVGALTPATERLGTTATTSLPGQTISAFFRPTDSGTYYVDVSDAGATNAGYTVTAQPVATDYADNPATTGTVAVNGAATAGTLANPGQHDWLAVSLLANQAYEFTVSGLTGVGAVLVGALAAATVRTGAQALSAGGGGTDLGVFFRPTTDGTYYVDVSEYGAAGDSYTVQAQTVTTDTTDNTTTTTSLTPDGAAATGTLSNAGQHDWLSVQLVANQAYEFTATGLGSGGSVVVGALTPADIRFGEAAFNLPFPGTQTAFFRPVTSGTYYVDISDALSTNASYSVSAQTVSTDLTDNPATTGTVTVGGPATPGTLANAGQHDWLSVSLAANQAYEFTVTGLDGGSTVLVGALTPATERFSSPSLPGSPGQTLNAFFRPTTSGTYYVDVSDSGSAGASYAVSVQSVATDYTDNPATSGVVAVACYAAGTRILTPKGERAVERLEPGGLVVTASGRTRRIKWIGRRSYGGRFLRGHTQLQPVRIHAGALGAGLPRRDLLVSPQHAVLVDGVLVPAESLVNGAGIVRARLDRVDYHHVELHSHDVLLAEGAPSESFFDDGSRALFHNFADYVARYGRPDGAPPRCCAPRVVDGPVLAQVRGRLAVELRDAA